MLQPLLSELVRQYVKRSRLSYRKIAEKAGIASKTTISNWANGYSTNVRHWGDLVRFGCAVDLTSAEINQLLNAGGQDTIDQLRLQPNLTTKEIALLSSWEVPEDTIFQAPPLTIKQLIGRNTEVSAATEALLHTPERICVLTGMGGVGKTALAVSLAHQLRSHFTDGVLWATLRPDKDHIEILRTFAGAYGREEVRHYNDIESCSRVMREVLDNKNTLVVLDDVASSADLTFLRPPTGSCALLVTSRNRQMATGLSERTIHVTPFDHDASIAHLASFVDGERMFAEATGAEQLVDFVGGLPLALRICGAFLAETHAITLQEYVELLRDEQQRWDYLQDWDDTEKNVLACFELSFGRNLPPLIQRLFAQLAVFDGLTFSVEAIAQITKTPLIRVKIALDRLAAISLIEPSGDEASSAKNEADRQAIRTRYTLHTLLHLFAKRKIADQLDPLREAAIRYFAEYAHRFGQTSQFGWIDLEWENITAAMRWAIERQDKRAILHMVAELTTLEPGLCGYLDVRGHWYKAMAWLRHASSCTEDDLISSAEIALKQGVFALRQTNHEEALRFLTVCQQLLEQMTETIASVTLHAYLCEFMARLYMQMGDMEAAQMWLAQGIELLTQQSAENNDLSGYLHIVLARVIGGSAGQWEQARQTAEYGLSLLSNTPSASRLTGLMDVGTIYARAGENHKARTYYTQAIPLAEQLGDRRRRATLLMNCAILDQRLGDLDSATRHQDEAMREFQRMGDTDSVGSVWLNMAMIQTIRGNYETALSHCQEAIKIAQRHNLPELEATAVATMLRPLWRLDDRAMCRQRCEQCVTLSQSARNSHLLALAWAWQGWLLAEDNQPQAGEATLQRAIQLAEENKFQLEAGQAWSMLGQRYDKQARYTLASEAYAHAREHLQAQDIYERMVMELAFVCHLIEQGEWQSAESHLTAVTKTLTQLGAEDDLRQVAAYRQRLTDREE